MQPGDCDCLLTIPVPHGGELQQLDPEPYRWHLQYQLSVPIFQDPSGPTVVELWIWTSGSTLPFTGTSGEDVAFVNRNYANCNGLMVVWQ